MRVLSIRNVTTILASPVQTVWVNVGWWCVGRRSRFRFQGPAIRVVGEAPAIIVVFQQREGVGATTHGGGDGHVETDGTV